MITINKNLKDIPVSLYDNENNLIGTIETNEEFMDIRLQIKNQKLTGYYFMFKDQKINIDQNGECENYPSGFFDIGLNLLLKFI
jgi:hypothetical protein